MTSWGNGYFETDRGCRESSLIFNDCEIAYTDYDRIIAYNQYKHHETKIKEYSDYYELPIEWID